MENFRMLFFGVACGFLVWATHGFVAFLINGYKIKSILRGFLIPSIKLDEVKTRMAILRQFPDKWFTYGEPELMLHLNRAAPGHRYGMDNIEHSHYGAITVCGKNGKVWFINNFDTDKEFGPTKNSNPTNPHKEHPNKENTRGHTGRAVT